MRPLGVVHLRPSVEPALADRQVGEVLALEDLDRQRAVEAFVLALRLRVVRPAVTDRDAKSQQPGGQLGVGRFPAAAAGEP